MPAIEAALRLGRHAGRTLLRRPRLTLVTVLTLALPVALNVATFAVVDAVLLRPLPLRQPDRLVRVRQTLGNGPDATAVSLAPEVWRRWRAESHAFTDIAAATGAAPTLTGSGEPQRVPAALVSANFFGLLGVQPVLGRDFAPGEDVVGAPPVVIVGDAFWRTRLGGSPRALGRTLDLDGVPHVVVGVLPPRFRHPYDADLFLPLQLGAGSGVDLYAPARLRPGVAIATAERELDALALRMADLPPGIRPRGARLTPLRAELVGDLRGKLVALAIAAGLVLLVAAANLAAVQLAQARARRGELAVRLALGAGRRGVAALLATEALLVAALAGALAAPLAALAVRALLRVAPFLQGDYASAMNEFDVGVRLGPASLLYGIGIATGAALLFGVVPALRGARTDLRGAMTSQRTGLGRAEHRVLRALVVAEIAVAAVVLVGSGAVVDGFRRLVAASPGFDTRDLQVLTVELPPARYAGGPAIARFAREAAERLGALPGVLAASATTTQPLDPGTTDASASSLARPLPDPPGYALVNHRQVLPGYLRTLGVRLAAGRDLAPHDDATSEPVVVLDRAAARYFWPHGDAVGQRLKRGRLDGPRPWMRVVGVVDTIQERRDAEVVGTWYLPLAQQPELLDGELRFLVRTRAAGAPSLTALRDAVRGGDTALAVGTPGAMAALLRASRTEDRFTAVLVALFATLALLLAAVGIYGLLAHWVTQRQRDLAVRAALGCAPARLGRAVVGEALALAASGVLLGALAALALGRFAAALAAEARVDASVLALALLPLAAVAVIAALAPAWRARGASPVLAMRSE